MRSHYRCGRVNYWLKIKNPAAPAVKREVEEDWGTKRWDAGVVSEMMHVTPFFGFTLALVIPGALVILLAALLLSRET
jgi:hypothetical protein